MKRIQWQVKTMTAKDFVIISQTSKATFFENPQEQQAEIYGEIKSLESKLSELMKKWEELEAEEE